MRPVQILLLHAEHQDPRGAIEALCGVMRAEVRAVTAPGTLRHELAAHPFDVVVCTRDATQRSALELDFVRQRIPVALELLVVHDTHASLRELWCEDSEAAGIGKQWLAAARGCADAWRSTELVDAALPARGETQDAPAFELNPPPATVKTAATAATAETAETEAARIPDLHRAILEASGDALIVFDEFGVILETNETATKLLGYVPGALLSRNVVEFEPTLRDDRFDRLLAAVKAHGSVVEESVYHERDGVCFPVEVRYTLVPLGSGGLYVSQAREISARKNVEAALRESEQRFRAFMDNNPALAFIRDQEGRVVYGNRAWVRLIGRDPEDAASDAEDPPQNGRIRLDQDLVVLREGRSAQSQESVLCRDGVRREFSVVRFPIHGQGGGMWVGGFAVDLTDRLEAETQLRQREDQQAAVGRLSLLALRSIDPKLILEEATSLVAETLGVSHADFVELDEAAGGFAFRAGRGWGEQWRNEVVGPPAEELVAHAAVSDEAIVFPSDKARDVSLPFAHHEESGIQSGLMAVVRPDFGSVGFLGVYVDRPYRFCDDDVTFLRTIANVLAYVLQRVRTQTELARSQERLELALDGGDLGLWQLDLRTRRAFFNERWSSMLGYGRDELRQDLLGWRLLVHPDDRRRVRSQVRALIRGWTDSIEVEYRLREKSGDYKWILVKGKVVARGPDGAPIQAAGTHLEVHRRRTLEEQLRHAQKMEALGTLSGGVAHDFNNVLQSISGNAELLSHNVVPGSSAAEYVDSILKASQRAASVVHKILTFCRQDEATFEHVDLVGVLDELWDLLRHSIPRTVQLNKRSFVERAFVMADAGQLMQVFLNLAANAVQAMKEQGRLEIELDCIQPSLEELKLMGAEQVQSEDGSLARIVFRDYGEGIPEELMHRIFDPFFTTKKPGEGTGLGLSMVHGILQTHGGHVTVSSRLGRGSEFCVLLPIVAATEVVPGPTTGDLPRGTERVLVCDDEEALTALTKEWLTSLGYRVETVNDPLLAVRMLRGKPGHFDLLLVDQTMPNMTGLEVARAVSDVDRRLRVLLMSGWSQWVTSEELSPLGIERVLSKPFGLRHLANQVRRVLDRRPAEANRASEESHGTEPDRGDQAAPSQASAPRD